MISSQPDLTSAYLRTPRAAALAGIIFSVLWVAVFGLMRLSVPSDPFEEGAWLAKDTTFVSLAMNLVPFAGVAFLWFVGVLRDRLGAREDQFFATVFLGSDFYCWRCCSLPPQSLARSSSHFGRHPTPSSTPLLFISGAAWPTG